MRARLLVTDPLLWLAAGSVLVLAAARALLAPSGVGLALRLTAALACVLVVPGVAAARLAAPAGGPALWLAAAPPWGLVLVGVAQTAAFAARGDVSVTLAVGGAGAVGLLLAAARWRRPGRAPAAERSEWRGLAAVLVVGVALAVAVWARNAPVIGDAVEHLARVRKLVELPGYPRVGVTELFRDAQQHPGYAFPLWHAALAVWAVAAGVDPAAVVGPGAAVLTPLVLVAAYALGAAALPGWAGGVAVALAQVGLWALADGLVGALPTLTGPAVAGVLLLTPPTWAAALVFLRTGERRLLWTVAAGGLALAVVHPTYAAFALVPLGGMLAVRALVAGPRHPDVRRLAAGLGAVLVPFGAVLVYLLPVLADQRAIDPDPAEVARQMAVYAYQIDPVGDLYRLAPETVARMGPLAVAGLLAVPVAGLAARARWAGFVLGGSLAVLPVLLVPALFTLLGEAASYSQARRLQLFLPLPLAVAGGCALLARAHWGGPLLALGLGAGLAAAAPGDWTYRMSEGGGPAAATWAAAGGGLLAVAGATLLRRRWPSLRAGPAGWAAACAAALVLPVAATGAAAFAPAPPDRDALPPALVTALRAEVPRGAVVFSDDDTAYRVAGAHAVYVNTAATGHVWDRPEQRSADAARFLDPRATAAERRALLSSYAARWVVTDALALLRSGLDAAALAAPEAGLTPVRRGGRYTLWRVTA